MKKLTTVPIVVYIDEAWRGPIAGPVTVGLVIGSESTDRSSYQDSKSLSAKQRQQLAHQIKSDSSIIQATWSASAKEIDHNGIIWALRSSVMRGLYLLIHKLQPINYSLEIRKQWCRKKLVKEIELLTLNLTTLTLVIDWNHTFWIEKELPVTIKTIIKWDRDIPQISAASILAKTTRDELMARSVAKYPWYGFDRHMWYGTKKHYEAIAELGLCEIHRKKWIHVK